jgi:acyl-CoA synthetase (AMP-forming)/AMP-acid ligase II
VNVGLAVPRSARRTPHAVAVFDGVRSLTYAQLEDRSNRFGNLALDRFGLEDSDRVALLVPNRLEVPEVMTGTAKAGLAYVGLNFRLHPTELEAIFANAEPRLLVTCGELAELAHAVADPLGIPIVDVDDPGPDGYESLLTGASHEVPDPLHRIRPEHDFCIVYTSGTTGTPKGVWFDHGRVLQHATVACLEYEIDDATRYLCAIPHNSSVNITLVPVLLRGGAIGFTDSRRFDPAGWAAEVASRAITHSYLVPTQLYRLLDQLPAGTRDLVTMRTLGYGAAPMSPDRVRELVDRFGPIFNQLYGMAEVASIGTMLRKSDHVAALAGRPRLLSSAGQPSYLMDIRLVDDEGRDVPTGQRGEVVFAAPYMMKGYYRDPERTAATLVDGWIHSGDIGEVDDEGYLYIVDRKKDLIIRGGYNIAPTEVESVLLRHPAVLEAGVIGIPDPEWGESVLAVVALRADARATDGAELVRWCRDDGSLASVKLPQRVELVDALPKNAVGKIAKNELRDRFWTGDRKV